MTGDVIGFGDVFLCRFLGVFWIECLWNGDVISDSFVF